MDWVEQDGTPGTASWVTTRLTVPMSTRFALRGPGEPVRHPRCERGELQQRERLHGSGQEGAQCPSRWGDVELCETLGQR